MSKGVAALYAGDTLIAMDGTYDNEGHVDTSEGFGSQFVVTLTRSGNAGNPITIRANNRGNATLDGGNTSAGTDTHCAGADAYINLNSQSFITIEGFVIDRTCSDGISTGGSGGTSHHVTIRHNEIKRVGIYTINTNNGGGCWGIDGIFLGPSTHDFLFDGNTFHDIGRYSTGTSGCTKAHDHGIYAYGANHTIINNVFRDLLSGWGIQQSPGATNMLIANNTFTDRASDNWDGQIALWGEGASNNVIIRNNIFYQPKNNVFNVYAPGGSYSGYIDGNLVYGLSSINAPSGFALGTVNANLAGTADAYNPDFISVTAPYDYHLQDSSPAIDAGMTIAQVPTDFDDNARSGTYDIGAYEYGSGGPIPPTITTTNLLNGIPGVAYSQTLAASGDTPITWSIVSGTLTACNLNLTSGGNITGTPATAAVCDFTVRATNAAGTDDQALTITISPIVQMSSCTNQTWNGSTACSFSATPTAGNLIAVAVLVYSNSGTSGTVTSISDNATGGSNSYSATGSRSINSYYQPGVGSWNDIWYAHDIRGGGTAITPALSTSLTGDVYMWEIAGVHGVSAAAGLNSDGTSAATPTGAPVTTGANSVIVALLHPGGSTVTGIHAGNVFTSDSLADGMALAHYVTSSSGTYSPQWDMTSATYAGSTVAFGSGGTPPTITTISPLPVGTVGVAYSQTLTAIGDTPITWNVVAGSLPACNLSLASGGGVTGTPLTATTCSFTARATNPAGASQKDFSVTINQMAPSVGSTLSGSTTLSGAAVVQ